MLKYYRKFRKAFWRGPTFLGHQPKKGGVHSSVTYKSVLWINAFYVRNLTLAGRIMLPCLFIASIYSLFSILMPLHYLAYALAGMFFLDLILGLFFRPNIKVTRKIPDRIGAGQEHVFEYTITNLSSKRPYGLLVDSLPQPMQVSFTRGFPYKRTMEPEDSCQVVAYVSSAKRGIYHLPVARVDCSFPFHLIRFGCQSKKSQCLVVYPAFTPMRSLNLVGASRYQPGGISLSSKVGHSMEFIGCREFRDGDSLKHIHWRSWARLGEPVVKEFCDEYLTRSAVVIDTYRSRSEVLMSTTTVRADSVFEAGMSLSAAVADYLEKEDFIIDLFAAGPEVYHFQGGRSLGHLDNVLDIIASLKPDHKEPFLEFSQELLNDLVRISNVVIILIHWNDARRDLISRIVEAGVFVNVVLLTADGKSPADLPSFITVWKASDVHEGLCTVL